MINTLNGMIASGKEMERRELRDYFAAAAMTGMLDFSDSGSYDISGNSAEVAARSAYLFADAMLAAREVR